MLIQISLKYSGEQWYFAKRKDSLKTSIKLNDIWGKVFTNGPNKICERQPLKIWNELQILLGPFLKCLPDIKKNTYLPHYMRNMIEKSFTKWFIK